MKNFGLFVSSQTRTLWTFTAFFTLFVWTRVNGQPQVVGPVTVRAALGDTVTLPCHVEPEDDVQSHTIEWSKPDLKKDPSDPHSGVKYVLLYRFRREIPQVKIQSYIGRSSLSPESLKHGDASLQIKNLTLEDQGKYRCYFPLLKSRVREAVILLEVGPNLSTTETPVDTNFSTPETTDEPAVKGGRSHPGIVISVVLFALILITGVICLFICNRLRQHSFKSDVSDSKCLAA